MKQEIELKYQIACLADFKRLLATLRKQTAGSIDTLKQKNIFFDTPALDLRSDRISLRLRRQGEIYYLCVKQAGLESRPDALSVRLEFEAIVSQNIADLLLAQQISPLEVLSQLPASNSDDISTKSILELRLKNLITNNLQVIGSFINNRTRIPMIFDNHKVLIELDQTTYPDKSVIFEMEIEFSSEQEARTIQPMIENMLRELGLVTNSSMAKSDRLYRILFGNEA